VTNGATHQTPQPKTKYVLVPLDSVTKTISKFTTPEYQARRKSTEDFSNWSNWPTADVSMNRRPHSQSEGSAVDWKSAPRTWTEKNSRTQGKDRSNSADYPQSARRLDFTKGQRPFMQRNDDEFAMLQQKQYLARHAASKTVSPFHASPLSLPSSAPSSIAPISYMAKAKEQTQAKSCLAPFNPDGGKLKDYAAYFFCQAYGLEDQQTRPHEEIVQDAQALTNCSVRAINEVLYGFSYDDLLCHLRAAVPAYPAKVPNKERNLDLNREILIAYANSLSAPAVPRASTAPVSPVWERAKQIATFAAPAALLLSPFIF
jgi:hypothetical protein